MGIQGLLPLLKSIQKPVHLKDYPGTTMAVDAYSWLHKGAFFCAMDICLDKPTRKYVDYCMGRIRMMRLNGVEPYLVFDGCPLPMKAKTDDDRTKRRAELKEKGKVYLKQGLKKKAEECFQACVDITPEMAVELIKDLIKYQVKYVVAPYEADAQLAYLEKAEIVDAIITEDSDLLVFGCKKVLYKLSNTGNAIEVCIENIASNKDLNFKGWTFENFMNMCILSGCDYLENIPGIGLKTAYKALKRHGSVERVIQDYDLDKSGRVPSDYMYNFKRAQQAFMYQQVFDPISQKIVHLESLPSHFKLQDVDFVGNMTDENFAIGIAKGEMCPLTGEKIFDVVEFEIELTEQKERLAAEAKTKPNIFMTQYVNKSLTANPQLITSKSLPVTDNRKPLKPRLVTKQTSILNFLPKFGKQKDENKLPRPLARISSKNEENIKKKEGPIERVISKYFQANRLTMKRAMPNMVYSEISQKKQKTANDDFN